MTDLSQRVANLETFIVASVNAQAEQGGTEETKAQAAEALQAIVESVENTPDENGHTPKMLRDWTEMQDGLLTSGEAATREEADELLDVMFGKIERGELNPDGSPL